MITPLKCCNDTRVCVCDVVDDIQCSVDVVPGAVSGPVNNSLSPWRRRWDTPPSATQALCLAARSLLLLCTHRIPGKL